MFPWNHKTGKSNINIHCIEQNTTNKAKLATQCAKFLALTSFRELGTLFSLWICLLCLLLADFTHNFHKYSLLQKPNGF